MARSKSASHVPVKPLVYALLALLGGVVLLILSQVVRLPDTDAPQTASATTAPATVPASAADKEDENERNRRKAAADSLSGMLLLFSAAGFLLCAICVGWLVVEVRKARPAWKRQQKYPKMRKR